MAHKNIDASYRLSFGESIADPRVAARWFYLLRLNELMPGILADLRAQFSECEPPEFNGLEYLNDDMRDRIARWCVAQNFVNGRHGPPEWIQAVVSDTIAQQKRIPGLDGWCLPTISPGSAMPAEEINGVRFIPDLRRAATLALPREEHQSGDVRTTSFGAERRRKASNKLERLGGRKLKAAAERIVAQRGIAPAATRWAPEHFDAFILRQHRRLTDAEIAKLLRADTDTIHAAIRKLRPMLSLTFLIGRPRR